MTELQEKNFHHTLKELEAANSAVAVYERQKAANQSSVDYAQKALNETSANLAAAELKLLTARRRFEAVLSEINPPLVEGGALTSAGYAQKFKIHLPSDLPIMLVERIAAANPGSMILEQRPR